jgi:hypothetical protein
VKIFVGLAPALLNRQSLPAVLVVILIKLKLDILNNGEANKFKI